MSGEASQYYQPNGNGQYYQQQAPQYQQYPPQQPYAQQYQQYPPMQHPPPPSHAPNYQQQEQYPPYQSGQPHPPPPPPTTQPGYTPVPPTQNEKYSFEQAFKIEKPKWNDLWAAILFILVFAGFVVVSALAIRGYATTRSATGGGVYDGGSFGLTTNTIILFAAVLGLSLVLGYAYITIARLFPKQFIIVTLVLNLVAMFGTAIYMLTRRYYAGGIVFLVFGALTAFFYWTARRRIPFSALMLETSIKVAKNYGHVYFLSFVGGVIGAALAAWFSITLVAIYARWQPNQDGTCRVGQASCSSGTVIGLIVFITFAMYWMSEVLKNVLHTTVSGVYGAWYFCSTNFPADATRAALRRSMTYSFGSICFGSLIVAIINLLRQIARAGSQDAAADGNFIALALFCCLRCVLAVVDWAVQFLNRYAFSYMGLYGKSYLQSAKDTWKMIKDRGIDALINECLLAPVFNLGALFIAYLCALLAFVYLYVTDPAYNQGGSYTGLIVAFSFLIGFQMANVFTTPISSGVDTIFVAAAWDPDVMIRDHRGLYDEMVRRYPEVQQAIHA